MSTIRTVLAPPRCAYRRARGESKQTVKLLVSVAHITVNNLSIEVQALTFGFIAREIAGSDLKAGVADGLYLRVPAKSSPILRPCEDGCLARLVRRSSEVDDDESLVQILGILLRDGKDVLVLELKLKFMLTGIQITQPKYTPEGATRA